MIRPITQQKSFVIICFGLPLLFFFSWQSLCLWRQNEIAHGTVLKDTHMKIGIKNDTAETTRMMNSSIYYYSNVTITRNHHLNNGEQQQIRQDVVHISTVDDNDDDDDDNVASSRMKANIFHFCRSSRVHVMATAASQNENELTNNNNTSSSLSLLYQCSGDPYEDFADRLHAFASNRSTNSSNNNNNNIKNNDNNSLPWKRRRDGDQCSALVPSSLSSNHYLWGKRDYPLADNVTVLAIGNSHLRQISKTIACQYAHTLTSIHFLPAAGEFVTDNDNDNDNDHDHDHDHSNNNNANVESFVLEFSNGARWISVTNQVLLYSNEWKELIEEFFLNDAIPPPLSHSKERSGGSLLLEDMDAIVLGKFTTYEQAKDTNFERTMNDEEEAYYNFRQQQYQTQQQQQQQHQEAESSNSRQLRSSESSRRKKRRKKRKRATTTKTSKNSNESSTIKIPNLNQKNASTITTDKATTIAADEIATQQTKTKTTRIVSFASIPPPDMADIARIYNGPILSLSMFSKGDMPRVRSSYDNYREQCILTEDQQQKENDSISSVATSDNNTIAGTTGNGINKNLYLVDARRYIEEMGIECGTDDKKTMGTCHEPPPTIIPQNTTRYRDPSDMHRCAGARGGHVDLVAWDVIEGLYSTTTKQINK